MGRVCFSEEGVLRKAHVRLLVSQQLCRPARSAPGATLRSRSPGHRVGMPRDKSGHSPDQALADAVRALLTGEGADAGLVAHAKLFGATKVATGVPHCPAGTSVEEAAIRLAAGGEAIPVAGAPPSDYSSSITIRCMDCSKFDVVRGPARRAAGCVGGARVAGVGIALVVLHGRSAHCSRKCPPLAALSALVPLCRRGGCRASSSPRGLTQRPGRAQGAPSSLRRPQQCCCAPTNSKQVPALCERCWRMRCSTPST